MSVKITWTCYNKHIDFFVYKSLTYMNENNLPMPIASVLKDTYEFIDIDGNSSYYMIGSILDGKLHLSSQVKAVETRPGHFIVDVNFNYTPPVGSIAFTVKPN